MINNFLQPFSKAILFIEENEISIDRTLFIIDILIKHLQISIVNPLFFFLYLTNSYTRTVIRGKEIKKIKIS
jgi:hypothetical protein